MENFKVVNISDVGLHIQSDSYFSYEPTNSEVFNPHIIFRELSGFLQYFDKTKFLKTTDYDSLKTAVPKQIKEIIDFFDEFNFNSDFKKFNENIKRLEYQAKSLATTYDSFQRYYNTSTTILRFRYLSNAKFFVESHPNLEINSIVYSLEIIDGTQDQFIKIKLCPI